MSLPGRRIIGPVAALLTAGALMTGLTANALASHVLIRTTVPGDAVVGQMLRIPVALRSLDGTPIQGTTVVFSLHASFAGVDGQAEVGRAVTDQDGVAALAYRPRNAGHHELRMEYTPPGESEAEVITTSFDVTGGEQLYRSAAAVEIPGVGAGLLMWVLATVWSILLWVAFRLVAISRSDGKPRTPGRHQTA
jgi:hypothetical protein